MKRDLLIQIVLSLVIFTGMFYTYHKVVYVPYDFVAVEYTEGEELRLLDLGIHWKTSLFSELIYYDVQQAFQYGDKNITVTIGK